MSSFGKTFEDSHSPLAPMTPQASSDQFIKSLDPDSSLDAGRKPGMAATVRSPHIKIKVNFAVEMHPKGLSDKFKRLRGAFENGQSCMPRSPLKVLKTVYRMVSPKRKERRLMGSGDCDEQGSGDYSSYFLERERAVTPKAHKQSPIVSPPVRIVVSSPGETQESASDCQSAERKMRKDVKELLDNNFGTNRFHKNSPVAPKALDGRVASLLKKSGLSKFSDLFQREGIDMQVFRTLTRDSLTELGISKAKHQDKLLQAVEYANKLY